jgi:hypothetical protein
MRWWWRSGCWPADGLRKGGRTGRLPVPCPRERWGGDRSERVETDGRVTLTVTVTANEHFLGEVLGWGGACQVVAPADVREALQRRIAALQSIYG